MKKIYFVLCLLVVSLSASAQHRESHNIFERLIWDDKMLNVMLDTRFDFQTDLTNGKVENAFFHGQTIKLWFAGEIIPGIRYRIRQRLNRPQTLLREGYSSATDHAWLAFDIGKHWTITAGKQSVQLGTYEYDYNPADIYLPTMVYNDFDGYKAAVNVGYHFLGQTINLQLVNSDAPQFASADYESKALAVNTLWEGNLFNGVLRTRWGYGAFQHTKSKFYHWVTLGTQINVGAFTSELDYYMGRRDIDYSADVDDPELGLRNVDDQSLSVNLKYNFGKFRPFIKGTWNQREDTAFDSNAYETYGIQAVLELYPFTNKYVKDLRFHAMYAYSYMDFQGEFTDLNNKNIHQFLIGTRWLFKAK